MKQIGHFIQGQYHYGDVGVFGTLYNPSRGEPSGKVAFAGIAEVNAAVNAAKEAFASWAAWPVSRRAKLLFDYRELVKKQISTLARLISDEHGKTLEDAKGSIQRGLDVLDYACGIPHHLKGHFSENVGSGVDIYDIRQPMGVCVGITPFNFPGMIPLWMFPLALACGNTFILKPSEKDPSCPLKLVELFHEAGLPPGVLNLVNGDSQTVDLLIKHPDVASISFVGSSRVAEHIYKTGIAHGKRVQAFGGAKNHALVMPDAHLEQTAGAIVGAAYGSAGERCMAISVVVAVGDQTADRLIEAMVPLIEKIQIDESCAEKVDMGPLVTQEHRQHVIDYINLGVEEGASLILDGRGYVHPQLSKGFFLGPCLFDHVTCNMRIYQEEIFGPVLCIVRAKDYETGLDLVSRHHYGNGCAIFTRDGDAARDFATRVQVGMVGINIPIPVPVAWYSFGGWKQSLFSDIGMHGPEALHFYTRLKTVTSRWPTGVRLSNQFNMPTHS